MDLNQQQESQTRTLEQDNIIYSINYEDNTASIIELHPTMYEIIIPRSINYESTEYTITSILEKSIQSPNIKSIQFPLDSELQTIEKNAFYYSKIERFTIPSSLTDLKEGWCDCVSYLNQVNVSPNNPRYKKYDDKMIIGKSSVENDEFDVLIFCSRDVETVKIPKFIKHIGSFAFNRCEKLHQVEIPVDSELQTIGKDAFSYTSIERFTIPVHLTQIGDHSFSFCMQLQSVEMPENSELQKIQCYAFSCSLIEKLRIPPHVTQIGEYAFSNCRRLQTIEIPTNSKLQKIEGYTFYNSSIECLKIPPNVTQIGSRAFSFCQEFKTIEIPANSKLESIDSYAFNESSIENIFIPSSLIDLKDGWCGNTPNLTNIIISPNNPRYCLFNEKFIIGKSSSEKKEYDVLVFCSRDIQQATLPSFIKQISSNAFEKCKLLRSIEIPLNSELQSIDMLAFYHSSIEKFTITSHLKEIGSSAFSRCEHLKSIEIQKNSELQKIDDYSFCLSSIEKFVVPPHLTKINEGAFSLCHKLKMIEVPDNSELQVIENEAFSKSNIESISIPSCLVNLNEGWCEGIQSLARVFVSPENPRYKEYDNQIVIGKSTVENDVFDVLVFCSRCIQTIEIPSFIKQIGPYAFNECEQLQLIQIPKNSELQSIEKEAFSFSSIEFFSVPIHLKKIGESAFINCENLRKIEIPFDSELQIIENGAFFNSSISCFTFPPHVTQIGEAVFENCEKLEIIEFDENSEIDHISLELFPPAEDYDENQIIIMIPVEINNKIKL